MTGQIRRRLAWIALVFAGLVGVYSWAGIAMSSSFAVAAPARETSHRIALYIYVGILVMACVVGIVSLTILWRGRRGSRAPAT